MNKGGTGLERMATLSDFGADVGHHQHQQEMNDKQNHSWNASSSGADDEKTSYSASSSTSEQQQQIPEVKPAKKGTWLDTLQMNPKMYWPKKYRYTIEPMPGSVAVLSVRERDHYEANGYIVLKDLLPKQTVQKFSNVLKEAASSSPNTQVLQQTLAEFRQLPQILRYVECFCGPNIMAMHTDWINHSSSAQMEAAAQASLDTQSQVIPRIEELFLHQDLFSLPFRPADRIVCLWAPFQESTSPTSDSLQSFVSIPGSHKSSELLTIDSEETVIYEPLPQALESLTTVRKQVLLNAGDVVLYHPLLRHATPSQSRLGSFSTFFASSECHYIEYLHGRTEELIPDHLKTIGNMPVTPENRWKDYGVLVKGLRSNL